MQIPSKIIQDDNFYKFVQEAFEKISKYYYKQKRFNQFESYCRKFIRPDWKSAFQLYDISTSFYRTLWEGWDDYTKRRYYQSNRNYQKPQSSIMKCYEILGISATKDKATIKSAYHKLCLCHHPDKGGSKEKFIEINQAYEYLMNRI